MRKSVHLVGQSLSLSLSHTHTHTHTYIYMYVSRYTVQRMQKKPNKLLYYPYVKKTYSMFWECYLLTA